MTTLGQNHLRRQPTTPATIDAWNLAKSMAFYQDRFADASGFTFVLVGHFDLPALKPLVERYLGALPSLHRQETWKDVGARLPRGVIEKTIEKGIEPKSQVAIVFTGPFEYDQMHRVAIKAMALVLQSRLSAAIRQDLGGTYSITASPAVQRIPAPEYSLSIQWACDPQRTEALIARVFQEVESMKALMLNDRQMTVVKEAFTREFEANSQQNGYLAGQIALAYQDGEDVASVWDLPRAYERLDAAMIQQAAQTYLNAANYVKVTLFPEKK
jgi:zinc protease